MPDSPMIETLRRAACLHEWVEEEIRDDPGCALSSDPQQEREEHLADAARLRALADAFEVIEENRERVSGIWWENHPGDECWTAFLEKRDEYDNRSAEAPTFVNAVLVLATLLREEEPDGD